MSLTLPNADMLIEFGGEEFEGFDEDRADMLIQLAADLLWLATGLEDDPTDSRLAFLVTYAILDMAVYLAITRDSISQTYGPYQSERIGNYSYSKAYQQASKNAISGNATGVLFFDKVVQYLCDQALYVGGLMTSESVFHRGYQPLYFASVGLDRVFSDPNIDRCKLYSIFGNADDDEGVYQA